MTEQTIKRIVLVGHCAADAWMLKLASERAAPGLPVETVGDFKALEAIDLPSSLLLVNRVLSFGYPVSMGVDLIRQLHARPQPPRMLLISDQPDAQRQAEAAGAVPGFGKAELLTEKASRHLRSAAGIVAR
ncbi:MAG: hypothetical protein PHU85_18860 [Phycisphaerae bacterium]|nr:hypothetical protein [Phycisphaerae bacterium]